MEIGFLSKFSDTLVVPRSVFGHRNFVPNVIKDFIRTLVAAVTNRRLRFSLANVAQRSPRQSTVVNVLTGK